MDSRWLAVALALVALATAAAAQALALGPEAVCGPDDFECWDPYETTARLAKWALGFATAGALLAALARHRIADLAGFTVALVGGFWTLMAIVFSSPGSESPCGFAWCPDPAAVAALFSLVWGFVVASLMLRLLRAPPRRGATVAAGVALGLLPPGAGLLLTNHGGLVDVAAYAMLALAAAGGLVAWGLLRRPSGRESA